jgi:cardiolipin synthase
VQLLRDGEEAFPAMLADILAAKREILLEMYWFGSDGIGSRFADLLARRAREGLRVRILYDAVGSIDADDAMFVELEAAGCEVAQYNPIAPWRQRFRLGLVNRRDHRKMLILDGQIGYTGGVNLADPWAPEAVGGKNFRDDMIRIDGPVVGDMRALFMSAWGKATRFEGDRAPVSEAEAPRASAAGPTDETCGVEILANQSFGGRRAIRREYLSRIANARRYVHLTNSYFLPDRVIRRALFDAVARGIDVKVLLPGQSDVFAVYFATRRLYEELIEGGVQLFEWHGTVLHSKTAVIDGNWCTVGTYNLDYRSFRFNLEVTAAIEDCSVAEAMERRFAEGLRSAKQVELRHFRYRPLLERIAEQFFYLFRKLL